MNERAGAQLRVIKAVINALGAVGISAWLFGGGLLSRHHDVTAIAQLNPREPR
jgi:hypothetical protein